MTTKEKLRQQSPPRTRMQRNRDNPPKPTFLKRCLRNIKRQLDKKRAFILSFLITYLLTIILTFGICIIQMDQEREKSENITNFTFYECNTLDTFQFIAAKVVETIVPTTITFCASVLFLQSNFEKKPTSSVLLFALITILVVGGIILPTFKTETNLIRALWFLGILCSCSLCFSWSIHAEPSIQLPGHKNEPCDGKIIF